MGVFRIGFGLFYADDFGTEYKKTNSSVFKGSVRYNEYKPEVYNSPFLNELLVKPDTIEDLDRRWQKMINTVDVLNDTNKNLRYDINIFTGEKDVVGVSHTKSGVFGDLNDYDPYRNLSVEDQFGVNSYNNLDFMYDLDNDFF